MAVEADPIGIDLVIRHRGHQVVLINIPVEFVHEGGERARWYSGPGGW